MCHMSEVFLLFILFARARLASTSGTGREGTVDGDTSSTSTTESYTNRASRGRGQWHEFNGYEYYASSSSQSDHSFTKLEGKCTDMNGTLALVKSQDVQTFIESLVDRGSGVPYAFFIGLRNVSGQWKWDDGEILNYTYWGTGQPSPDENCVVMGANRYEYQDQLKWNNIMCESARTGTKGFICQRYLGHKTTAKTSTFGMTRSTQTIINIHTTNEATATTSETTTVTDTTSQSPGNLTPSKSNASTINQAFPCKSLATTTWRTWRISAGIIGSLVFLAGIGIVISRYRYNKLERLIRQKSSAELSVAIKTSKQEELRNNPSGSLPSHDIAGTIVCVPNYQLPEKRTVFEKSDNTTSPNILMQGSSQSCHLYENVQQQYIKETPVNLCVYDTKNHSTAAEFDESDYVMMASITTPRKETF